LAQSYIHGYSEEEQERLITQNDTLYPYIYKAWDLGDRRHIVEIGCGVGAQMMSLLSKYPDLHMTGIEFAPQQVKKANFNLSAFTSFEGRYDLITGDAAEIVPRFDLNPDAVLMVWVLEHVRDPLAILENVAKWMPVNVPLYVTEVFHPSFYVWPQHPDIHAYWQDTLRCQTKGGGDPQVGIRLYNLLHQAGYNDIQTRVNTFYLDGSKSEERQKMLAYWLELMRSALHHTLDAGETTLERWQKAETAMRALIVNEEAVFYYSFCQAEARKSTSIL
jgi:ubiquinone/menaquinone biosynthesis C-methylase UbiE